MNMTNNYHGHSELQNFIFIQERKEMTSSKKAALLWMREEEGSTSIEKEECHSTIIILTIKGNVLCVHC